MSNEQICKKINRIIKITEQHLTIKEALAVVETLAKPKAFSAENNILYCVRPYKFEEIA